VFARKLRCRAFCSVFKRFNTHAAPRLHCRAAENRMKNRNMRGSAEIDQHQFRVDFTPIYNVSIHQSDMDLGQQGGTR
jgi:hypothetical protein